MSNRACCTTMTSRGDDLAWRSSLDAYRPLSIQGSCDLLHRIPTIFAGPRPYRSSCISGHGRSHLCVRSGRDATRLSGIPTIVLQNGVRMRPQSVRIRKRWSTEEREIEGVRPLYCQTIQAMLLRVAYDLVGSGMPLSSRMAPSIRFNFEMWRSRSSRRFSALVISASLSVSPAVLSGSRVSCS
jgi:hypothetical protein